MPTATIRAPSSQLIAQSYDDTGNRDYRLSIPVIFPFSSFVIASIQIAAT